MTYRAKLQLAFATLSVLAVGGLGLAVRREMTSRLEADYRRRLIAIVDGVHESLSRERQSIGVRLRTAARGIADDNRFRTAISSGGDRAYLLDYAGGAMRMAGFAVLQVEDSADRVVSSGHFRNEFDRQDHLPRFVAMAGGGVALTVARRAEGPLLALVRVDSLRLGATPLYLVGGVEIDAAYLRSLAPDTAVTATLYFGPDSLTSGTPGTSAIERDLALPFAGDSLGEARLVVRQSVAPLDALIGSVDRWTMVAVLIAVSASLIAAWFLSTPLSRPISDLASEVAALNLDRLDGTFTATDRADEVGVLARGLTDLADRLRKGAGELREAERRATTGDLARQVNHDVKNGLVPIRNVLKHLAEVAQYKPGDLPQVFRERKDTLDQGVAYLETLAANYARLTPKLDGGSSDVARVIEEITRGLDRVRTAIAGDLPAVRSDAVVLRRILENVIANAVETKGAVTVSAESRDGTVRVVVTDTGPGMSEVELERAFQDFYTTKPGGTGLGLSIVRRLVADLGGSLKVTSKPGAGTTVEITLTALPPYRPTAS